MQAVTEIEERFAQLPAETQLCVLERLIHRVREDLTADRDAWNGDLKRMAQDPDTRRELAALSSEFLCTEEDGLDRNQ